MDWTAERRPAVAVLQPAVPGEARQEGELVDDPEKESQGRRLEGEAEVAALPSPRAAAGAVRLAAAEAEVVTAAQAFAAASPHAGTA